MEPKSLFLTLDDMNVHVTEWGDRKNPSVVCWHGLTRNGRDFDTLAQHLAENYHVLCPDTIGRGLSQWSTTPDKDYCFEKFSKIAINLLDSLDIEQVRWIGTSMGGAIGLRIAGTPEHQKRISHLVLNDIGAGPLSTTVHDMEGAKRIIQYVASPPAFKTFPELVKYYQAVYSVLGLATEEEWSQFTQSSYRRTNDGKFAPDYDPNIALQFHHLEDINLWKQWDAVEAKVLLIRGEISDVLPIDVALKMYEKVNCEMMTIPNVGHAPALNTSDQITAIHRFLSL